MNPCIWDQAGVCNRIEVRTNIILDLFHKLKMKINEWESYIGKFPVSSTEIYQKFNPFSKAVTDLSNQALLAAVSTAIHRNILNLANILAQIKCNGLERVNSRIDRPVLCSDVRV